MSPEEKELLNNIIEKVEENNDMLRSMQRSMKWARIMSTIYWVFIIGSAVGAYYLIQPYIEAVTSAYGGAKSTIGGSVGGFSDTLKELLQ